MAKTIWKNVYIIRVYELAKSGMIERKIARVLGISLPTFLVWERKKPIFKMALEMGRRGYKSKGMVVAGFRDYVFKRLSKDLRILWLKINRLDKVKSGGEAIEAILSEKGVRVRQHLFLYAWTASNFSISQALRKVNISRATFDSWRKKDADFLKLVEEINWHKKNFFEDHLCQLVAGGDTSATIFVNRTFNRDRGYNEKVEVDMNLSGEVNQNVVYMSDLKLPLDIRKGLLKSIRKSLKNPAN